MDAFELGAQPHCPECGTVMHTVHGGYVCRSCQLAYLPNVDVPELER